MVNDGIPWRLPFFLRQNFDDDNVAVDGSVHVLSADEEDWLGVSWASNSSLRGSKSTEVVEKGRRKGG